MPGDVVKKLEVVGVGDHGEPAKVLRQRGNGRRAEKPGGGPRLRNGVRPLIASVRTALDPGDRAPLAIHGLTPSIAPVSTDRGGTPQLHRAAALLPRIPRSQPGLV
jgi:hypothetical protein